MARLDVYPTPAEQPGGLLDVQADLLSVFRTRVVVPLLPAITAPRRMGELNPIFDLSGIPHVMLTQAIAAVPVTQLRNPFAHLRDEHDRIVRALDLLFIGL